MEIIAILSAAFLGGFLYRIRGGWPDIPRPIEQLLFCLILIGAMSIYGVPWYVNFIATALCVFGVMKGHGHTMNYAAPVDASKLEDYEFFTKGLIGKVSDYWYKVIAHSFGGLLMTISAGFVICFYDFFAGFLIAFSGALKGLAYMAGWYMHPMYNNGKIKFSLGKFTLQSATEWGEFLTGAFVWGAVSTLLILI